MKKMLFVSVVVAFMFMVFTVMTVEDAKANSCVGSWTSMKTFDSVKNNGFGKAPNQNQQGAIDIIASARPVFGSSADLQLIDVDSDATTKKIANNDNSISMAFNAKVANRKNISAINNAVMQNHMPAPASVFLLALASLALTYKPGKINA